MKLTIFYIKDNKGNVAYTNTNEIEFASYVNKHMELGLGKYPTYEQVKNSVIDLEIGAHEITIEV